MTVAGKKYAYNYRSWSFNFHRHGHWDRKYCDVFICIAKRRGGQDETFIIPATAVSGPTFSLHGAGTKPYRGRYAKFRDRWSVFSETELMARQARELGVPAEHLILAPIGADSTIEEALALRPVLAERGFRNILVVTSNFHTRRAKLVFVEVYRPRATIVHVSASPDLRFDPKTWWQTREGRKYLFLDVLKWLYTWWELWTLPEQEPVYPPAGSSVGFGFFPCFLGSFA